MARKKRGLGFLGTLGLVVIIVLVVVYLQHHHVSLHLPDFGGSSSSGGR